MEEWEATMSVHAGPARVDEVWEAMVELDCRSNRADLVGERRWGWVGLSGDGGERLLPLGSTYRTFMIDLGSSEEDEEERVGWKYVLSVKFLPVRPGLNTLGGFKLVLLSSGKEKEVGRWAGLGDVWVGR